MKAGGRHLPLEPWMVLVAAMFVTAGSALVPLHEPRLPGTLRVGVAGGEDPDALERAFGPFAAYLGQGLRRSGEVVVLDAEQLAAGTGADLLLVPGAALGEGAGPVLAWAKPVGRSGFRSTLVLVGPRGARGEPTVVALGDSLSTGGEGPARALLATVDVHPERIVVGPSSYRHEEALTLLRHGVVEAALVWRSAFDSAVAAGRLDPDRWFARELGEARPRLALVAGASLSDPARSRLRARALNLDHFRYDPRNAVAGTVMQGLAQLGIGGFAPVEPFPSLRP